jgi:hypothetical protein
MGSIAFLMWGSAGPMPGLALALVALAPLLGLAGSYVGRSILRVVVEPRERAVKTLLPVLGVGMPMMTGMIDIYLRMTTA